jgi:hypothetical protein
MSTLNSIENSKLRTHVRISALIYVCVFGTPLFGFDVSLSHQHTLSFWIVHENLRHGAFVLYVAGCRLLLQVNRDREYKRMVTVAQQRPYTEKEVELLRRGVQM